MQDLSITVPEPFAGVSDLGFTVEYPEQVLFAPLKDVPLLLEGPAPAMRRLTDRLNLLAENEVAGHGWTSPIALTDEVVLMAFRDRSLAGRTLADGARASLDYVLNLVRPVVFPFLQDCAQVAQLRLSERIELRVQTRSRQVAGLQLRIEQIVRPNGSDPL